MNDLYSCPVCACVGKPLRVDTTHAARGVVCANCKSDRIVQQDSRAGRQMAAMHGLQLPFTFAPAPAAREDEASEGDSRAA